MTQIDETPFPDPDMDDISLDDLDVEGEEDDDELDEAGSNDPDAQ